MPSNLEIPKSTMFIAGISFVLLLLIASITLLPGMRKLNRMEEAADQARREISIQDGLLPTYGKIVLRLNNQNWGDLPMPVQGALPMSELGSLGPRLEALAANAGLDPLDVHPQPASILEQKGLCRASITARGDLDRIREFLLSLGGLPFLRHIESVHIVETRAGSDVQVNLWVQVATSEGAG